jgi:NADH dehydrogenase
MSRRAVVTGAFSYIGSAVARSLARRGWQVHTLTNRATPPGAEAITSAPLRFDPEHLARELRGADAFVSTYWVRLPFGGTSFDTAVTNARMLVDAAARAGVGRLVSVSVSNAALDSGLGYYVGKAHVDAAVRASGLPHAIVRPTLVVGPADVLTSNIAWCLRRFPLFLMPGGGRYRLQPVTLDDTGEIVADATEATADLDVDAAGPVTLTFAEYVRWIANACGVRRWVVGAPGALALAALRVVEPILRDTILTREELLGLRQERLVSHAPPLGRSSVEAWLLAHGATLGRRYVNDRRRHFGDGRTAPILAP